jgi:hypothetical protein
MADTIKQLCNQYKHFDGLGSKQTAFTNDANTTAIVKNVLVQGIGAPKSIDLYLDGNPIYRNLSVPSNGTIKLENENLIVAPNSTLEYKASVQEDEVVYTAPDDYTNYPQYGGTYIDRDGKAHTIITQHGNAAPWVSHWIDGKVFKAFDSYELGGNASYTSNYRKIDVVETDSKVFFAVQTVCTDSYYSTFYVIGYDKTNEKSYALHMYQASAGSPGNYSNINPRIAICKNTGTIASVFKIYDSPFISFSISQSNYSSSQSYGAHGGVTFSVFADANNSTMGFDFLPNGNLIAISSSKYFEYKPNGTLVTDGNLAQGNASNYSITVRATEDGGFLLLGGNNYNIRKYDNTFNLVRSSVGTYGEFFILPNGQIMAVNSSGDVDILNNNDLTVQESYSDIFYNSSLIGNARSCSAITGIYDTDMYYIGGATYNTSIYNYGRKSFYNAINVKIDGVEVTDA